MIWDQKWRDLWGVACLLAREAYAWTLLATVALASIGLVLQGLWPLFVGGLK